MFPSHHPFTPSIVREKTQGVGERERERDVDREVTLLEVLRYRQEKDLLSILHLSAPSPEGSKPVGKLLEQKPMEGG